MEVKHTQQDEASHEASLISMTAVHGKKSSAIAGGAMSRLLLQVTSRRFRRSALTPRTDIISLALYLQMTEYREKEPQRVQVGVCFMARWGLRSLDDETS